MAALYELTHAYKNLLNDFDEDTDEEAFEAALAQLQGDIKDKVHNISGMVKTLEAEVDGLDKETKRIARRKMVVENKVARLERYMRDSMLDLKVETIKTSLFTVKLNKAGVSVEVVDKTLVPVEFLHEQKPAPEREVDKNAVKAAWKAAPDVAIPGVRPKIGERSVSIK